MVAPAPAIDLVVEGGEAPLVFWDQQRREAALAIARHLDAHRAVLGKPRLAAGAVGAAALFYRRSERILNDEQRQAGPRLAMNTKTPHARSGIGNAASLRRVPSTTGKAHTNDKMHPAIPSMSTPE